MSGLKLLLVDDDAFLIELLLNMLHGLGVPRVDTALSGARALQLLDAGGRYDIVISDLDMPGMDGIEFMRHLAGRRYTGEIILLTGTHARILQTAEALCKAHQLKLRGVLQKPVERTTLQEILAAGESTAHKLPSPDSTPLTSTNLADAIGGNHICAYYQPRVAIATRTIVAVEALARWRHPDRGLVPPENFIPLAEASGLIRDLTHCVLKQAIAQGAAWHRQGLTHRIAANTTVQDMRDIDFPDWLLAHLTAEGLPPSAVVLELTESMLMTNLNLTLDTLVRLRLKGITLAVDDFGTGYSNLAQLKRAPFGELKIDRSLLEDATVDSDGLVILETAIVMGKKLGMRVVIEGVETAEHWDLVSRLGADEVQGYLIARPMPADQLPAWVDDWNRQSR